MSGGTGLKSTACSKAPLGGGKEKKVTPIGPTTGAISLKMKAPEASGQSKHSFVAPLGKSVSRASSSLPTARPSPSYIVVGERKPDGGYGKALMRWEKSWWNPRVHLLGSKGW
jgi:hypothetical protein